MCVCCFTSGVASDDVALMLYCYVCVCVCVALHQVFLVMVWNFELYMLPITLLLIFLKNLIIAQIVGAFKREPVEDVSESAQSILT